MSTDNSKRSGGGGLAMIDGARTRAGRAGEGGGRDGGSERERMERWEEEDGFGRSRDGGCVFQPSHTLGRGWTRTKIGMGILGLTAERLMVELNPPAKAPRNGRMIFGRATVTCVPFRMSDSAFPHERLAARFWLPLPPAPLTPSPPPSPVPPHHRTRPDALHPECSLRHSHSRSPQAWARLMAGETLQGQNTRADAQQSRLEDVLKLISIAGLVLAEKVPGRNKLKTLLGHHDTRPASLARLFYPFPLAGPNPRLWSRSSRRRARDAAIAREGPKLLLRAAIGRPSRQTILGSSSTSALPSWRQARRVGPGMYWIDLARSLLGRCRAPDRSIVSKSSCALCFARP